MPSMTGGHDFKVKKPNGTVINVANTAIRGWRSDTDADLGLVGSTDANGVLVSTSVNVPAGTTVLLTHDRYQGHSGTLKITTI